MRFQTLRRKDAGASGGEDGRLPSGVDGAAFRRSVYRTREASHGRKPSEGRPSPLTRKTQLQVKTFLLGTASILERPCLRRSSARPTEPASPGHRPDGLRAFVLTRTWLLPSGLLFCLGSHLASSLSPRSSRRRRLQGSARRSPRRRRSWWLCDDGRMQTPSFGKALVSLLALVLCSVFVAASALVASSASSGASAARRKGFLNFSQGQRGLAFAASHSCVHHRKSDSLLFVSSGQGAHSPRGFGGWGADAALGCTDTAGPWRRRSFVCVRRAAVKCTATFISCGGIGVGEDDRQTQQCQSPLSPGSGDRNAAERERETRERERDAREERKRTPFVLDGSAFHGASAFATAPLGFQTRMVPYDR